MKLIPVNYHGSQLFAIVDDCDYNRVSQYTWCAKERSDGKELYVFRYIRLEPKAPRKYKRELLHNFIMQISDDMEVDHRDADGLNNTRANLRAATHAQNCCNQRIRQKRGSRYKGVIKASLIHGKYLPSKPWRARIRHNDRLIDLGHFHTDDEAARAYNEKALELFGEFAKLNEILI